MSGGSFEYLCYQDSTQLLDSVDTLERMKQTLANYDLVIESEETQKVIAKVQEIIQSLSDLDDMAAKIKPTWHAMEWFKSGDSSYENLIDTSQEFRRDNKLY